MKFWKWGKKESTFSGASPSGVNEGISERLNRPDLTRDGFFLLYAKLVEQRFGARNMRFEEADVLHYELQDGMKMTAFMQNAWLQCEQDDEPRSVILDRYLAALEVSVGPAPITKGQIIAIVKDARYVSVLGDEGTPAPVRLAGDLWAVYAIDLPKATQALSLKIMDALGLHASDLPSLSIENLKKLLPTIECLGDGPWFLISAGPDYSASLLLLDDVWEDMAGRVDGDVIAVVPSRDIVLCTGSRSPEGLQAIRRHAKDVVSKGHHVVSATLLRRVEGRWVNFD